MTRRRLLRVLAVIAASLLVAAAVVWFLSWPSPPFYELARRPALPAAILTDAQYAAVHEAFVRPYVVECAAGTGRVALFGATHTRDPRDPQLATLRDTFARLRPTAVLVEGRPGAPLAALGDPVEKFGEMGAALARARAAKVPVWSWEPSREAEVAAQLERFPAERVALFYVLRPYVSSRRFGRPADPDAEVERTRRRRTAWRGLEGTLPSMAALDEIWQRDFPGLPGWRETSDEHGWPGYLGELSRASNELRDEHLAGVLLDLVARSERVLAVAGSSHAVKLEPTLRAACGEPFDGTLLEDGRRQPPPAAPAPL